MIRKYLHGKSIAIAGSVFFLFFSFSGFFFAENAGHIPKAEGKITIDGIIQEGSWEKALVISKFYEFAPGDNTEPSVKTTAFLTYDQENFYVAFKGLDPDPKQIRARYADRDQIGPDDQVGIILDTFNDQRYSLEFFVNPLGVQTDLTNREQGEEDASWDTIWSSAGRITSEGFEVEIAIPFKSLRFPDKDVQTWRFILVRNYPRKFRYQFSSVPLDRGRDCLLCQAETYSGMEGVKPGRNIEIVPSLIATEIKNRDEDAIFDKEAGISTAWGVTPNLTLNATLNPDFSQIEADAVQIDVNTRFALFYPEKRPFFLEGQNYFESWFDAVYPRTIADPSWGLKFTGKENKNAYGILIAQDEQAIFLIPSNQGSSLFTWDHEVLSGVFRYRRDISKDSTLGVLFTGRQNSEYKSYLYGVDGHIRIAKVDFFDFQFLGSKTTYPLLSGVSEYFDGSKLSGNAYFLGYKHGGRNWVHTLWYDSRNPEFRADLGFIPRVDDTNAGGSVEYYFYGDGHRFFSKLKPMVYFERTNNHLHTITDWEGGIDLYFELPKQITGEIGYEKGMELYKGVEYRKGTFWFWANSRFSKAMTAFVNFQSGDKVDYVNEHPGDGTKSGLQFDVRFGKHIFFWVEADRQTLNVEEGRVFKATVYYLKATYHFNNNLFFRATYQLEDIKRNPGLYVFPVKSFEKFSTTQLLFTYKINPFTLLYLGYSDSGIEEENVDRTTLNKTYFLKLSYAFRP